MRDLICIDCLYAEEKYALQADTIVNGFAVCRGHAVDRCRIAREKEAKPPEPGTIRIEP